MSAEQGADPVAQEPSEGESDGQGDGLGEVEVAAPPHGRSLPGIGQAFAGQGRNGFEKVERLIAEVNALIRKLQYGDPPSSVIREAQEGGSALSLQALSGSEDLRGALGKEKSSLLQLESYRSLLLSHLSLADTVAALRLVNQPEVFADPPAFDLNSFLRTEAEQEEFEA